MMTPNTSSLEKWILRKIHESIGCPPIRLALGRGPEVMPAGAEPVASVLISDWSALARLLLNPEIGFGDGYAEGRIEVEGDLVILIETVLRTMKAYDAKGWKSALWSRWLERMQANTLDGSARNIHRHYDLTADFYKLWLDPQLVYSCAYFPTPSTTLDEAQLAKMDYLCRKVQLRPGDKVVETGCPGGARWRFIWPSIMASRLEHSIFPRSKFFSRGNSQKEKTLVIRWNSSRTTTGTFPGTMTRLSRWGCWNTLERNIIKTLGRIIHRSIGDSGHGLLHFIGRNQLCPFSPWIRKRIFPGACIPTLRQIMDVFEPGDFSVLDVKTLPPGPIHLLLTDVVMPKMGSAVAEKVAALRPGVKVISCPATPTMPLSTTEC